MYKELQARTDSMRRGGGNGGGGMQMMGAMGSISNMSPGLSNHSGGGGGHMVCGLRGGAIQCKWGWSVTLAMPTPESGVGLSAVQS